MRGVPSFPPARNMRHFVDSTDRVRGRAVICTSTSMALSILSGDELEVIFLRLCNPFDTRVAMAFGSASRGLWAPTQVARQQLRVQSEAAAALCRRAGIPSCKKLREATTAR